MRALACVFVTPLGVVYALMIVSVCGFGFVSMCNGSCISASIGMCVWVLISESMSDFRCVYV